MNRRFGHRFLPLVAAVAILLSLVPHVLGQPAPKLTTTDDKPPLKQEELEQLLAPIALYPDSLLTQMLMASTYPIEVVQAERWVKSHKGLTGDALAKELEPLNWDPSVKSMVNFPEQLTVMSEKLDLTLKIGNAFLEQQADVLNTIQVLRNRAQAKGNLKSNEQQKVTVQAAPAPSNATTQVVTVVQPPPQIITVESTSPDIVYVPSYNPTYVYGGWPYPSYPPYYYYPPGYYYGSNLVSFGVGVAIGAAWGYAWGNCNWGNADIDIDVDRNIDRNRNINRESARQNMQNRQTNRQDNRGGNRQGQGNRQSWQHDPSHRRGAAYRDTRTADRFGGAGSSRQAAQAREQFRGRSENAFGNSARGTGAGQMRSMDGGGRAGSGGAGAGAGGAGVNRGTAGGAGGTGGAGRAPGVGRVGSSGGGGGGSYSGTRGGTFSGVDRGGGGARQESARGRSSGGYGGSRGGGGGGARGGGGRGGGGRR